MNEKIDAKLTALREIIEASIAEGGSVTDDEIDEAIARRSAELRAAGYGD